MSFSFAIISTNPKTLKEIEIYNLAYSCFKDVWKNIFGDRYNADALKRQKYICCILKGNEVIAIMSVDIFNLQCEAHMENTYFMDYPKEFFLYTQKNGVRSCITLESLTVRDRYRGELNGIRVVDMIVELAFFFSQFVHGDMVFGPVVRTNGASHRCKKFGAEVIIEDFLYRGLNCDMLLYRNKNNEMRSSKCLSKNLVRRLWEKRLDFTGLTDDQLKSFDIDQEAFAA